ncbi:hypothetical protein B9G98_00180 [Wickerhamiella sorbophila]|uniref:Uncharacterized protein n=1 Tax=Wickerhamiella sorbophila TaxID=45607 RepID=A0A2T0FC69_9ASCO|nr:hypothetical protein B9G98_00180 [Wickerhamiella sorbophila]PRT52560.1 hypothetical protein B9G98_00180 [Wickerhamiella sorbophila]
MARQIRPVRPVEERPPIEVPKPNFKGKGNRSVFLIMLSIPLVAVTTAVLYKRVLVGQPKRVQTGEYTPDGGLRMFTEDEREDRDSKSWMTRIFGREK